MTSSLCIFDVQIVLILSLFVVALCFYLSFLWRKRHMFLKSWNYPGPLNLPIIGASYHFMKRPEHILGQIVKLQEQYPEGFKVWFGNRLIYCLHEPNEIEKVLGSSRLIQKEILYKHLTDIIGEGLMTAPPVKWKNHRKHIMPSFNQKVLDSFVEVFAEQSCVLNEILAETVGTEPDLFGILSRCTLDIVCETAMGLKLDIQRSNSDYGAVFDKIMVLMFLKIFQIWNHVDFIWKILGYDKKIKKHTKKFYDLADTVIKEKLEEQKLKNQYGDVIQDDSLKRMAFLDYILECKQFDATELRDEINIFLLAGTDTTAATLTFLFAILGIFPDIQKKVYEEIVEVMGKDRQPEYKDLSKLVFTERVIKETLRIYPVGAFFLRAITEDIDMGHYILPKGSSTYFGLVFIHRNPKYWPDPLKFDPDRFLPEEVAKRHPCTYIPFSYGPRNCVGMKYAMMNMKVILSSVIRKYNIHCGYKSIEDIKIKANIVLRFQDGAKVSFTPRNQ